MTKISIVLAVLISFVISAAAGPVIIPILRKLKVGQTVRDDGPQTHLKKNGTPTMGGIIFLLAVLITSLIYAPHYPKVIPVLFMTVGFVHQRFCRKHCPHRCAQRGRPVLHHGQGVLSTLSLSACGRFRPLAGSAQ